MVAVNLRATGSVIFANPLRESVSQLAPRPEVAGYPSGNLK